MVKETYKHLKTKTLEDLRKKTTKNLDWMSQGEKVRKSLKKLFEIVKNM